MHFKTMDTEIEEVKQGMRKVQEQIDCVEGQLTQAVKEDDVAYLRKQMEQLRDKELPLLKACTAGEITCPNC